ncbi:MAG: RHS repeat-associated core domain-containing protein [Candidatus Binataceae bacterium]
MRVALALPGGSQSLVSGTAPSGYGNVYGMAGMELDPTGLHHAGARYYNPGLRRFISEDPDRGKPNLFSYAGDSSTAVLDGTFGIFVNSAAGNSGAPPNEEQDVPLIAPVE